MAAGQPYKICPACGQPAALETTRCSQCGHVYRTQFTPNAVPPQYLPARQQSASWVWVLLGVFGVVAAAVGLLLIAALVSSPDSPGALPGMHPGGAGALTSSGVFQERRSSVATPTVVIYTDVDDGVILTLTGQDGRSYTLDCYPGRNGRIQVPAGDYSVEVHSATGSVGPNQGTAVFRRYREYEAGFTAVPLTELEPLRLGDN